MFQSLPLTALTVFFFLLPFHNQFSLTGQRAVRSEGYCSAATRTCFQSFHLPFPQSQDRALVMLSPSSPVTLAKRRVLSLLLKDIVQLLLPEDESCHSPEKVQSHTEPPAQSLLLKDTLMSNFFHKHFLLTTCCLPAAVFFC